MTITIYIIIILYILFVFVTDRNQIEFLRERFNSNVIFCVFTLSFTLQLPIVSLVQVSATTVRVEWSQPSASVTGYSVHYSSNSYTYEPLSLNSTSTNFVITIPLDRDGRGVLSCGPKIV